MRLQQLIVNLLDNAIKYTREDGCVVVTVNAGTHARVTVEDNGVGIPSDSVPHVFDCFYRADKARARDTGGAGLGLAIAKAICAAHGGSISVTSTEGSGSVFTVELPLASSAETATAASAAPVLRTISETSK